jgi:hypothetical protein
MNTDIHRLLDEAFAGVDMTPDAQDLKEEVRANLVARVAELEASGIGSAVAAQTAISELGDVRELLGEPVPEAQASPVSPWSQEVFARHRVRPRTAFVVRTVVYSLVLVAALGFAAVGALGVLPMALGIEIALLGLGSMAVGLLVGDSLSQETTTSHPLPIGRASGFALASFIGAYGLGFGALVASGALDVWAIILAGLGVVASIVLFSFLAATQTNRKKAWVRQSISDTPPNRFEEDPETAARFGIYTAVIFIVTFGVITVLVFTVGWLWGLLALVGGLAVMMLVLARMLFGPRKPTS